MGLFNDTTLAMAVGKLTAQVEALRERIERLEAAPSVPAIEPRSRITPKIQATITALSGSDAGLARHLKTEAEGMLVAGEIDEADVLRALITGERGES